MLSFGPREYPASPYSMYVVFVYVGGGQQMPKSISLDDFSPMWVYTHLFFLQLPFPTPRGNSSGGTVPKFSVLNHWR